MRAEQDRPLVYTEINHRSFVDAEYGIMAMKQAKRKALEAKGWRFGSAREFLGLSAEEAEYIELKLALSEKLKAERQRQRLSQKTVAERINSSQSRIAKMEAGDPSVSVDLLIRSLFALGATKRDLARTISRTARAAAWGNWGRTARRLEKKTPPETRRGSRVG